MEYMPKDVLIDEIRTPLSVVFLTLYSFKDGILGDLSAEQRGAIDTMYEHLKKVVAHVDTLAEVLSKETATHYVEKPKPERDAITQSDIVDETTGPEETASEEHSP